MAPAGWEPAWRKLLPAAEWALVWATSAKQAVAQLDGGGVGAVIVAERASPHATLGLLRRLSAAAPTVKRLLVTAAAAPQELRRYAGAHHADALLAPPLTGRGLRDALRALLAERDREGAAHAQALATGAALGA
ncbi:MAG: response regulator, partial [Gammaproteobacteria bacterium]|nr:response regulator [Gammaproteobacteria bacterium]NIT63637.1 response regulator [Gammaproteobacteria bacterium]NIV20577.1 hypothetical protein [Gammaproteobacteria bacterium]NIY32217.1 hypothetical protein [Gammaproteobacteria bacterium]